MANRNRQRGGKVAASAGAAFEQTVYMLSKQYVRAGRLALFEHCQPVMKPIYVGSERRTLWQPVSKGPPDFVAVDSDLRVYQFDAKTTTARNKHTFGQHVTPQIETLRESASFGICAFLLVEWRVSGHEWTIYPVARIHDRTVHRDEGLLVERSDWLAVAQRVAVYSGDQEHV
jgi:penicillin-binding protein-related factor A (putative recombinase)